MFTVPGDYVLHLDLDQIGTLDETAFETAVPEFSSDIHTIAFWFLATNPTRKQVLANVGNKSASQTGWSLFLHNGHLVFRATFDGRYKQEIAAPLLNSGSWHHFAGIINWERQTITGHLDGSGRGWHDREVTELIEPDAFKDDQRLLIGGYTDSAGGHFDYTFGRIGTGLVDDFRVYTRALQPDEIATFLNQDKQKPVACFEFYQSDERPSATVSFDARDSHDETGQIVLYYWDFGDGRFGSGPTPSYTYAKKGIYKVRLSIVSDSHAQETVERTIHITRGAAPLDIVPVFENGKEGYACYRIPSIIRAANKDLVAFAEARLKECSDATPVIRIVCKRSSDNGQSWGPLQVIANNVLGEQEYGCMNPSPVVDLVLGTGRIVLVFNKKEFSEWDIVRGQGVNRTFCVFSDDHGRTWQDERDITLSVHKPYNPGYSDIYPDAARPENRTAAWRKQVPLPGHAVQLLGTPDTPNIRGRLLFAASYTIGEDSIFDSLNYVFWSDDLGQSWQLSGPISRRSDGSSAKGLNETMAVELENGDVMINSRNYRNGEVVGRRAISIGTFDEGGDIQFQPAYNDPTLIDSGVQASMIRYTRSDEIQFGGKSRLLFANPNHPKARINMTVRLSYNEGRTWPVNKVIDPGPSAYSDLVIQEDMRIGLLYEQGNQGGITYTSFSLDWLTSGQDSLFKPGANGSK